MSPEYHRTLAITPEGLALRERMRERTWRGIERDFDETEYVWDELETVRFDAPLLPERLEDLSIERTDDAIRRIAFPVSDVVFEAGDDRDSYRATDLVFHGGEIYFRNDGDGPADETYELSESMLEDLRLGYHERRPLGESLQNVSYTTDGTVEEVVFCRDVLEELSTVE